MSATPHPPFDAPAFALAYPGAWNRRDGAALRGFFDPQVVYREIALRETLRGIDAVLGVMRHLAATFLDMRWDVLEVVAESPDRLAIPWMSRRTIGGAPNEAEGVSVMHRRGGLITLNADFRHRGG